MSFGFTSGAFERIAEGLYRVRFDTGFASMRASYGLNKLAFEVFYCLFTTQGSIPDDPSFGTLIRRLAGQIMVDAVDGRAASTITGEILKAEGQIRGRQAVANLPAAERLRSLVIDEVELVPADQACNIRLFIINDLGHSVGFEIVGIGVTA